MLHRRSPGFLTISRLVNKEASPEMIDAAKGLVVQLPQYESVNDLIQLLDRWIYLQIRPIFNRIVINDEVSQSFCLFQRPVALSNASNHLPNATASVLPGTSAILRYFLGQSDVKPIDGQYICDAKDSINSLPKESKSPNQHLEALSEMREASLELVMPFFYGSRLMGWLGLASKSDGKEYGVQETQLMCDLLEVYGLFLERSFRSEKEAFLGFIPQGIAHDMRNWLAPVSACIQLQAEGKSKSLPQLKKLLPMAIQGIELWNYYLSHSLHNKTRSANWKPIRIDKLVKRAMKCFIGEGNSVALVLECPVAAIIYGDEVLLLRLFGNFISNALRLSPDTGEIVLSMSLKNEQESKSMRIGIYVADKGPGIVPELLKAFYQPTCAALGEKCGTNQDGLGLAICRQIAYLHGGCLSLEKNQNGGASIGVELPCLDPSSLEAQP